MRRLSATALVVAIGCSAPTASPGPTLRRDAVRSGPFPSAIAKALDEILSDPVLLSKGDIERVGRSNDLRAAWPLIDLLRFHHGQTKGPSLLRALGTLTGVRYEAGGEVVPWVGYTNLLLREEVTAPPGYFGWKRSLYVGVHDAWVPFFDPKAKLDWREVTWGGVLRDGIRALTDPPVVPARRGTWLRDDDVVFGLVVGDAARAYPRRVLEVHELVNDTLGGRRIALPYCTLCGAPIPYFTDDVPGVGDPLELRTSGLLRRSNKLMYDVQTESLFDQFNGHAVSGPLGRAGVTLRRLPITVTTWGAWKRAHPDTTVTPKEIDGRAYGPDPLGERDDAGPIFPVGKIDPRLEPQEVVLGVRTPAGAAVAFPVAKADRTLRGGGRVELGGVILRLRAGGLSAFFEGRELVSHEAYWFAWSQFNPNTRIWGR